jgi:predicted ATPase
MDRLKLQWIAARGFKCIKHLHQLDLRDVNVLIGANGAGKSSFLQLFPLLQMLSVGEGREYIERRGGIQRLLHFGPYVTQQIRIDFAFYDNEEVVEIINWSDGDYVDIASARSGDISIEPMSYLSKMPARPRYGGARTEKCQKFFKGASLYHFLDTSRASRIRSAANFTQMNFLLSDGSNLPAFLYYIRESSPSSWDPILSAVRKVNPFFGEFVLEPEPRDAELIRLKWRHRGDERVFDASDLSDGTLRFIALAALLLQPHPPHLILLDEPELGLHPAALALLSALIYKASARSQIVLATQSPTFVSHFDWEDLVVVDRLADQDMLRRLSEAEVEAWLEEFSLGEIWEKNVIGARPK